tara:strand:+ start:8713 stop:8943 length:231 start_codon:yes stop_codon:yes gene_type:complete
MDGEAGALADDLEQLSLDREGSGATGAHGAKKTGAKERSKASVDIGALIKGVVECRRERQELGTIVEGDEDEKMED